MCQGKKQTLHDDLIVDFMGTSRNSTSIKMLSLTHSKHGQLSVNRLCIDLIAPKRFLYIKQLFPLILYIPQFIFH